MWFDIDAQSLGYFEFLCKEGRLQGAAMLPPCRFIGE
jgi:hypothetical protein